MSKLSEYSKFDHLDDDDDDFGVAQTNHSNVMPVTKQQQPQNPAAMMETSCASTSTAVALTSSSTSSPAGTTLQQQQQEPKQQEHSQSTAIMGARIRRKFMDTTLPSSNNSNNRTVYVFEYNGQVIYEFEQGLSEMIITVPGPPTKDILCKITPTSLQLGLKGSANYFLDELTYEKVDVAESTWTLEEEEFIVPADDAVDCDHKNDISTIGTQQQPQDPGPKNNIKKTMIRKNIVIYLQKVAKGVVWPAALKGSSTTNATGIVELDPSEIETVKSELLRERWQEENPGFDFSEATFNGSIPNPRTYMGGVRY